MSLPTFGVSVFGEAGFATFSSKKPDPSVSVVCLRVCAGGVEHAFDRVCGAGDVGSAFDVRECRSDQHHQECDDADDDEQFEQRKTPNAFGVTLFWRELSDE